MIHFVLVRTRTGKPRLSKWTSAVSSTVKAKIEDEVSRQVLTVKPHSTAFFEYGNYQIIFRRYAGLYFILGVDLDDALLPNYEFIQLFVESLDAYFGNVCELDLVFKFDRVLLVLDELLLAGEVAQIDRDVLVNHLRAYDNQE
jgi:hypothetical protein